MQWLHWRMFRRLEPTTKHNPSPACLNSTTLKSKKKRIERDEKNYHICRPPPSHLYLSSRMLCESYMCPIMRSRFSCLSCVRRCRCAPLRWRPGNTRLRSSVFSLLTKGSSSAYNSVFSHLMSQPYINKTWLINDLIMNNSNHLAKSCHNLPILHYRSLLF